MTQLTDKIYAVQAPDDLLLPEYCFEKSIGHMLNKGEGDDELVIRHRERFCGSPIGKITIDLPPGTYRFLFATKTATEEDARKVVDREELFINGNSQGIIYCNYWVLHDVCEWFKLATDSLNSLLRSKKCDPNKNYALIEKQSSDDKE